MEFDPILLARVQFAFVVSFHILFPAFTIGLASYIAVLEARWRWTGNPVYRDLSVFWIKIFAVSFGMGVVSGIVMSFQFGTNWSRFSDLTGNVLGPLLSYEVVTAFFLEATFLGILLFGRNRVPGWLHMIAALAVAIGTLISAFWILAANSWMHTPAGYLQGDDGRFFVESWLEVVFNPSFPYRFMHMVTAAYLTTAFVVMGVSSWYLLKGRHVAPARVALGMGLGLITLLAPAQIMLGDAHGLNTLEHQPIKVAAMEGHWEPSRGAPTILFAIPDEEAETNHYEIGIPYLGSLILTHSFTGEVPGLKQVPPDDRPPVAIVFWTFRVMVAIGFLMLTVGLIHVWFRWKKRDFAASRWFLRLLVACTPIGFLAILAGWFTTEIGRQPYVVYGLLRTTEAASPAVTADALATSLAAFLIAYGIIFPAGVYFILRLIGRGPDETEPGGGLEGRPKRPLSAVDASFEPAE